MLGNTNKKYRILSYTNQLEELKSDSKTFNAKLNAIMNTESESLMHLLLEC